jgi:hypothetical protein
VHAIDKTSAGSGCRLFSRACSTTSCGGLTTRSDFPGRLGVQARERVLSAQNPEAEQPRGCSGISPTGRWWAIE